ncbi:hypothetical protein [Vacuolonema iberomarrocanum]|uniref:hypothetical protein n=1 Tax=Vacuolonema iberomarrocanum TaxID=3454632 RepID=UPI001A0632D0|nr:hypothetical protein [filamentous cyanobacterium LEGE 07170]
MAATPSTKCISPAQGLPLLIAKMIFSKKDFTQPFVGKNPPWIVRASRFASVPWEFVDLVAAMQLQNQQIA